MLFKHFHKLLRKKGGGNLQPDSEFPVVLLFPFYLLRSMKVILIESLCRDWYKLENVPIVQCDDILPACKCLHCVYLHYC